MGINIGAIGVFHPHGPGHLAALAACPEVERIFIWDQDEAEARFVAEGMERGEFATGGLEGLLADADVPIFVNLQRDCDAAAVTIAALRAGKWVYGDKPGAHNAAQMAEVAAVSEATGNHFCPCYANRLMSTAGDVSRLLRSGAIGEVWSFNAQWMTSQVALRGAENWLFHSRYSAGGILTWLACHWIDLLRFVLGDEVTDVMAMVATQCDADIDVEDTASVILRFSQGAVGTVRAGYALNPFPQYETTDLYLQFEGSQGGLTWYVRGPDTGYLLRSSHPEHAGVRHIKAPPPATGTGQGYSADFWAAFLAAWQARKPPPATAHDALAVLRVIEAAYQSSADGIRVRLTQ